jgi:hypothetical protein
MAGGECVGMVSCWSGLFGGLCGEDGVVVVCDCVQSACESVYLGKPQDSVAMISLNL